MKSQLLDHDTLMLAEALLSRGFAKITLLGASLFTALLAALQTQEMQSASPEQIVVAASSTLRLWCLVGGLIGALVRVSVRPPKNLAGFARSFTVSLGFSLLATPMIARKLFTSPDIDQILCTAGANAFLAWLAVEGLEKVAKKWIGSKIDAAGFKD